MSKIQERAVNSRFRLAEDFRAKVAKCVAEGLSDGVIAERFGKSRSAIRSQIKLLQLNGTIPPTDKKGPRSC